jgi:hypothetical protein
MLNLFHGKLFLRANQFTTRTANDRNSTSTTYAVRAIKMDIYDGQPSRAFSMDNVERMWIQQASGGNLPADQLQAKVAEAMKMDPQLLSTLENAVNFNPGYIKEPEDALSKGKELEVTYNPTSYWTMRFNVTQIETIQSAVAQDLLDYLNERMPVWTSVIDPTMGDSWYSELTTDPATGKVIGVYQERDDAAAGDARDGGKIAAANPEIPRQLHDECRTRWHHGQPLPPWAHGRRCSAVGRSWRDWLLRCPAATDGGDGPRSEPPGLGHGASVCRHVRQLSDEAVSPRRHEDPA